MLLFVVCVFGWYFLGSNAFLKDTIQKVEIRKKRLCVKFPILIFFVFLIFKTDHLQMRCMEACPHHPQRPSPTTIALSTPV